MKNKQHKQYYNVYYNVFVCVCESVNVCVCVCVCVCVYFIHCTHFECLNSEGNYCTNSHSRTKQVVPMAHTRLYANNHTMKYMTLYRFQMNSSAALHHSSDDADGWKQKLFFVIIDL